MKFANSIFVSGQMEAINTLSKKPLDVYEAYKLVKLLKSLSDRNEIFVKARLGIFEKYGKKMKNGDWQIKEQDRRELATGELNKLLAIEEEYELESKIKVPEDIQLSAVELILLEDIIDIPNKK